MIGILIALSLIGNPLEQKITFQKKTTTFKGHLDDFAKQTGVEVSIDHESFAKHGISVAEFITVDTTKEYAFNEALNLLTTEVSHTNPGKVKWLWKGFKNRVYIFGVDKEEPKKPEK